MIPDDERCSHRILMGKNHGQRCIHRDGHAGPHRAVNYQPTAEQKRESYQRTQRRHAHPCANHAVCGNWCTRRATHCADCARLLNGAKLAAWNRDRVSA